MKRKPHPKPDIAASGALEPSARERILGASFEALCAGGYSALNTREIAARAQVSKRELYSEFGSKQGIVSALIESRSLRMRAPFDAASVDSATAFAETLVRVGVAVLTLQSDPAVIAVFRLAIAAAGESPEVPRALEDHARRPIRQAFRDLMARARAANIVSGEPAELASRFFALLTGDVQIQLLLGFTELPTLRAIERHARSTVDAFMRLYATGESRR
jgi:AcrR family transcriptional regulator